MAATKSEQFEHNENPAYAGFLLSGDTTGVFATVHCTSTPVIASENSPLVSLLQFMSGSFSQKMASVSIAGVTLYSIIDALNQRIRQ